MKRTTLFLLLLSAQAAFGQTYKDSMTQYIKHYVESHEVVKGPDRERLRFFDIDESYRVRAKLERTASDQWFEMPTSGKIRKVFRVYGRLSFTLHDTAVQINLYQSQALMGSEGYRNYLFLPFTDATTGKETYEAGRYIDLQISDIRNNEVVIDFNKSYNPYCAYVSGVYNCPVPPRENHLPVAIRAGEKAYGGHSHG